MDEQQPTYWFPAKRHGWGWGIPCRWQGWVVLIGFMVAVPTWVIVFNVVEHTAIFIIGLISFIALLTTICWLKGEKPSWR
jgi:hypothetical protein